MKGIVISGYYGFGHSGDDALLLSIINDLKKHGLNDTITVLSSNPEETKKIYLPSGICSALKYPFSFDEVPETKTESTARIKPTFTKGSFSLFRLSTKTPLT